MSRSEDNCAWVRAKVAEREWTDTIEAFAWTLFCLHYFDVRYFDEA